MSGFIPFLKSNGKYCLIDHDNPNNKGYREYENLDFYKEGFAVFRIGKKWGYIDKDELELKLEHNYDEVTQFENGIAGVRRDNLWRFINRDGVEITKYGYDGFNRIHNGFILTYIGKRGIDIEEFFYGDKENASFIASCHRGILDNHGVEIIPLRNKAHIEITEDLLVISDTFGYIGFDFSGKEKFNTAQYNFISSFYKGRAIAKEKKSGEVFIIDDNLNKIKSLGLKKDEDLQETYFLNSKLENGFIDNLYTLKLNNKWGFINSEGENVCDFKYDSLLPLVNGASIAGKNINGKMKYTFLNNDFYEIIPFKYDEIRFFSEGHAAVKLEEKWGVINNCGDEIIATEFNKIGDCVNGFIWASYGDYHHNDYYGKYGFYNNMGKKVSPLIYDWVSDFNSSRIAEVELNGKYGFINGNGKEITDIKYDKLLNNYNNFYFVELFGKRYVIDDNGKEFYEDLIEPEDKLPF